MKRLDGEAVAWYIKGHYMMTKRRLSRSRVSGRNKHNRDVEPYEFDRQVEILR